MKSSVPVKRLLWIALIVIVVTIPTLIFSTKVRTDKYNVQSINDEVVIGSRLGGHLVKGIGFIIETTQGKSFRIDYDMKNEAKQLMDKLVSDKTLWQDVNVTYMSYLFGFQSDVIQVTLSDGETFTFIY